MTLMQRLLKSAFVVACVILLPSAAYAQASIAGVARDASGAVLPGVTVEAASPALIEKARSVVSDGSGQYRIVDLRPGTYSVTFTLPGFATVKRDGIELTGAMTATINAEMRVGGVEETITVTGATPVVDVQGVQQQRVMSKDVIDTLPTGRTTTNMAVLIPGMRALNDVQRRVAGRRRQHRRRDAGAVDPWRPRRRPAPHGGRPVDAVVRVPTPARSRPIAA